MATITITTVDGNANIYLSGTGNVTVTEGTLIKKCTLENELSLVDTGPNHPGQKTPRTITITGDGITAFNCITLSALDISKDAVLTDINCFGASLTSLDVSGLAKLKNLNCSSCKLLTSLNASGCGSLEKLDCSYCKLTSLNASGCGLLETLLCYANELTSLNLTGCFNLKILDCHSNQLADLGLNSFAKKHRFFYKKDPFGNEIIIDIPDFETYTGQDIGLPRPRPIVSNYLTELYCSGNKLTTLNIKICPHLKKLACESNLFTSLDISHTGLKEISFGNSQLSNFNIKGCKMLEVIGYWDSQMHDLDFSKFVHLKRFNVMGMGNFTTLNLSNCSVLETIIFDYGWVGTNAKIIVEGCTALKEIISYGGPR